MSYHVAVILTDADKKILWVNNDFTAITGYTLPEVQGKKPSLLQGKGTEPEVVEEIRRGLNQQVKVSTQITNYRKNGESYPCRLTIHPVFDNDQTLTNFLAFEVDVNELPIDENGKKITERYQTSSLKSGDAAKLFGQLQYVMQTEKLYLDPKINLQKLATRLETNTKYLSQVINFHSGMNLQRFINQYRVAEAKQRMLSKRGEDDTLFNIALQCGFKNKSTFYKVFKQMTGATPLSFIKSQAVR